MASRIRFTSLYEILLAVDVKTITSAAGDDGNHVQALAVLHGDPLCLTDVDCRISVMNSCYAANPNVLSVAYADEIPTVLLVRKIFSFLATVFCRYGLVKFGITTQVLNAYLLNPRALIKPVDL